MTGRDAADDDAAPTATLPVPAPWRRFLAAYREVGTGSPAYAALADAYDRRRERLVPEDLVARWDADTRAGTVRIECVDGTAIEAAFRPVGRHDGRVLRWARRGDDGPTDAAARAVRDALVRRLPGLPADDGLEIGPRDLAALMALCAEALGERRAFCAPLRDGGRLAMFLDPAPPPEDRARGGGWLDTLRGRPSPASAPSLFDGLEALLARQLAAAQVAPDVLADVEDRAVEVDALIAAGEHAKALEAIDAIRPLLGRVVVDQEPAGWLLACEGACRLALGQRPRAAEAFELALDSLVPPDVPVLRLGLARARAGTPAGDSALSAVYLSAPERFAALATAPERAAIAARIDRLEADRAPHEDAPAALHAALAELCAHEREAWRASRAAAAHRTERHVLCEQDRIAQQASTARFRDLLLRWFTVPTPPSMGSMSPEPEQDPERIVALEAAPADAGAIDLRVVFEADHGARSRYRYRLVRRPMPSSTRPVWRIAGIWSVWPDEEIALR